MGDLGLPGVGAPGFGRHQQRGIGWSEVPRTVRKDGAVISIPYYHLHIVAKCFQSVYPNRLPECRQTYYMALLFAFARRPFDSGRKHLTCHSGCLAASIS